MNSTDITVRLSSYTRDFFFLFLKLHRLADRTIEPPTRGVTVVLPQGKNERILSLTSHIHVEPRLAISEDIPLLHHMPS